MKQLLLLAAVICFGIAAIKWYTSRMTPNSSAAKAKPEKKDLGYRVLSPEEARGVSCVRRILSQGHTREATQQLIGMMEKTTRNQEFFKRLQEWLAIWEKEGYTIRSLRSSV